MILTNEMTPENMVYIVHRGKWRSPVYETEQGAIKAMLDHYKENKRGKIEYTISKQYIYLLGEVKMLAFEFGPNSPCKRMAYNKEDIKNLMEEV